MKKRLANLLCRWAFKLYPSAFYGAALPEPPTPIRPQEGELKKFRVARQLSRYEINWIENDADAALIVTQSHIEKILDELSRTLYSQGAIKIDTEPGEGNSDSHDVIIGTVYAAVKRPK